MSGFSLSLPGVIGYLHRLSDPTLHSHPLLSPHSCPALHSTAGSAWNRGLGCSAVHRASLSRGGGFFLGLAWALPTSTPSGRGYRLILFPGGDPEIFPTPNHDVFNVGLGSSWFCLQPAWFCPQCPLLTALAPGLRRGVLGREGECH